MTATFLVAVVRAAPQARALEAVVWLVVGLAAAPSTVAWGRIAARTGPLRAYALACLLEAIGVAAGGLWSTPAAALLAAFLLGGTFMGITALGFAAARALGVQHQRRSFALITAGFGLGQIAGPIVAGILLDRTHSFAAPSLLARRCGGACRGDRHADGRGRGRGPRVIARSVATRRLLRCWRAIPGHVSPGIAASPRANKKQVPPRLLVMAGPDPAICARTIGGRWPGQARRPLTGGSDVAAVSFSAGRPPAVANSQ